MRHSNACGVSSNAVSRKRRTPNSPGPFPAMRDGWIYETRSSGRPRIEAARAAPAAAATLLGPRLPRAFVVIRSG